MHTAMDSNPSEIGVSMDTTNRHMSSEMSGPLNVTPNVTTENAQVANACPPAGERPNKTPFLTSGFSDSHSFLAPLLASCPGGLMAQIQDEQLIVDPSAADGLTATLNALRSLDGLYGVSFNTFTFPQNRCARHLVKKLSRCMPDSIVREELQSLNFRVPGVTQMQLTVAIRIPPRRALPPHTSFYQWRENLRCLKYDRSRNSAACECRWSRTWFQMAQSNARAASVSDTRSITADTHTLVSRVAPQISGGYSTCSGTALVLWLWWKPHSEIPWLCKVGKR